MEEEVGHCENTSSLPLSLPHPPDYRQARIWQRREREREREGEGERERERSGGIPGMEWGIEILPRVRKKMPSLHLPRWGRTWDCIGFWGRDSPKIKKNISWLTTAAIKRKLKCFIFFYKLEHLELCNFRRIYFDLPQYCSTTAVPHKKWLIATHCLR